MFNPYRALAKENSSAAAREASEVAGVKGLTIVGPLPAEIDLEIVYGAAATTDSTAPNAASAFVKFMAASENRSVWKEAGFEPPANLNSN